MLEETPFWPKREGSLPTHPWTPKIRSFSQLLLEAGLARTRWWGKSAEKAMGQTVGTSAQQTGVYLVKIHRAAR